MSRGSGVSGSGVLKRRREENRIPGLNWAPSRRSELIELNILSKLVGLNGLHQVLAGKSDLSIQPPPSLNIKRKFYCPGSPKISKNSAAGFSRPSTFQPYRKHGAFLPPAASLHRRYRSMPTQDTAESRLGRSKVGLGSLFKNFTASESLQSLDSIPFQAPKCPKTGLLHFCSLERRSGFAAQLTGPACICLI